MKRLLLGLSLAVAVTVTVTVTGCATITSPTGRTQYVGAISQERLNQMGEQAFAEYKAKLPQSNDAGQTAYVRCVVGAVTRQLPQRWQADWESALFVNEQPNAFALPGGKVGVYTGIFDVARNQGQLAAVIAHEIGHVVSHHHDERITRQLGAQFGLGIAGAILGSQVGPNAAAATRQLGGAAVQGLFLLPNNRVQETEADIVGQRLMARAGFDPREAVNLWQNMIAASSGSRPPEWLSTHPDPQSRIQELRSRADELMSTYRQARAAGHTPDCG